jgi:alpha-glucosidase
MQWDPHPLGGFTTGDPWLPVVDPEVCNVADQDGDPDSVLALYRALIDVRARLGRGLRFLDAAPGVLAYARGDHVVALNLSDRPAPAPPAGRLVLDWQGRRGGNAAGELPPRGGFVAEA